MRGDGVYRDSANLSYIEYLLARLAIFLRLDFRGLSDACRTTDLNKSSYTALSTEPETGDSRDYTPLLADAT